jgi:hypothetical protein
MRTSLTSLLLWSVGSLASVACAKECSYGDKPQIIAHTGEPVGKEQMYNGGQLLCRVSHSSFPSGGQPRKAH